MKRFIYGCLRVNSLIMEPKNFLKAQGGFGVPPEAIAVVLLALIIAGGFIFAKRKF